MELDLLLGEVADDAGFIALSFLHVARGAADHLRGQTVALGNIEGVAGPGDTDQHMEGRCEALGVELDGGVFEELRFVGVVFQRTMMGGHHRRCPDPLDLIENGHRQCGAFLGVGAGAELVEEHQTPPARVIENVGDGRHVTGERGKRLFEGLLVADIRENIVEERERASFIGRDLHAELVHEGEEAGGLQRNGLTPGVGARHDEPPEWGIDSDLYGYDGATQERMPRAAETHPLCAGLRAEAVVLRAVACACEQRIEVGGLRFEGTERRQLRPHGCRQLSQYALYLLIVGRLCLTQLVVEIDEIGGLDEERGAGLRHLVHDTFDAVSVVRAQRQYGPAVSLRRGVGGPVLGAVGVAEVGDRLFLDAALRRADARAQAPELRYRLILYFAGIGDVDAHLSPYARKVGECLQATAQRTIRIEISTTPRKSHCGRNEDRDRSQLLRVENGPLLLEHREQLLDVGEGGVRDAFLPGEDHTPVGDEIEAHGDEIVVGQNLRGAHHALTTRTECQGGNSVAHRVELEESQRVSVHSNRPSKDRP